MGSIRSRTRLSDRRACIRRPVCNSGAPRCRRGRGCIQRQRRECPRTRWKDGASPLRGRLVAGGRVRGVCGTIRSTGGGRSTPWPGFVMSNTVQAYKRHAEVQKVHSQPSCPEAARNRAGAGAPAGALERPGPRTKPECQTRIANNSGHNSDSGFFTVHGLHGPGWSSGPAARNPVRFPYAERVTAFGLAFPAGARVRGGSLGRRAGRTLPGIAPKGGLGWRTG